MAAVGISGVFRYGSRFLAHLLVVVLVGVVLVLTGNLVGEFLVGTLSSPDIRAPPSTVGWVGVVIALVGVLATVAGLGGLLYKLVADGTAVGTRSVLDSEGALDGTGTDDAAPTESETDGSAAGDSSPEPATAAPAETEAAQDDGSPPEQSAEESSPDGTVAEQPTTTEPAQPAGDQADASPQATESPEPTEVPPQQPPTEERGGQGEESEQPSPEPVENPRVDAEPADGQQTREASQARTNEQAEWTPPDPEEFEQHQSTQHETDPEPEPETLEEDPFAGEDATGYQDETTVVDERQFDDPSESATSWEDLQESSGGENTVDQTRSDDAAETDPFATEDRFDQEQQDPSETGQPPSEPADGPTDEGDAYDDEFVEDQPDEDSTYSFETEGDDDPLSDALGDE